MNPSEVTTTSDLQEYVADGRAPLHELYKRYQTLGDHGWKLNVVAQQPITFKNRPETLPILSLHTAHTGDSLWILAGIHGEEPAGPNAIAHTIPALINTAAQGIPIVLLPLLNPSGYRRNWRYANERRDSDIGQSVSDAGHVLPNLTDPTQPRRGKPSSQTAADVITYTHKLTTAYPPRLVIDHHEDEELADPTLKPYLYADGTADTSLTVAREVVRLLHTAGMDLQLSGTTRFGEQIIDGVVSKTHDGSIDEFLAAPFVIIKNTPKPGPAAKAVVVIETPTVNVPLKSRIRAHTSVINALPQLWQMTGQYDRTA